MKRLTVSQMVHECFREALIQYSVDHKWPKHFANAARRFVKMENQEKQKRFLEKFKQECRKNPEKHMVILPKGFGTFKEGL